MGVPDAARGAHDPRREIEPRRERSPDPPETVDGEHVVVDRVRVEHSMFSGPLPAPATLAEYDHVVPGLARVIIDQWRAETRHRHATVTGIRATDHDAMLKYYAAERRGQTFSIVAILGVLSVAVAAIAFDRPTVGVAGLLTGGAAAIWAMRRRSGGPDAESVLQLYDGQDADQPAGPKRPSGPSAARSAPHGRRR
jgi:uncharacterized membrane protein